VLLLLALCALFNCDVLRLYSLVPLGFHLPHQPQMPTHRSLPSIDTVSDVPQGEQLDEMDNSPSDPDDDTDDDAFSWGKTETAYASLDGYTALGAPKQAYNWLRLASDPEDLSHVSQGDIYRNCSLYTDPGHPSIRLLQLEPGSFDRPIYCNLFTRPLYDEVQYDALSYSWGTGARSHQIYFRGEATLFRISSHL
jgi:hypothetical protein